MDSERPGSWASACGDYLIGLRGTRVLQRSFLARAGQHQEQTDMAVTNLERTGDLHMQRGPS
jgi:hypothetical protein